MSFFNRPAWAQGETENDEEDRSEDDSNLFSHSANFQNIVAERRQREEEREERRKAKENRRAERTKSKDGTRNEIASPAKDTKKRRIDAKESEKLLRLAGMGPKPSKRQSLGESDQDSNDEEITFEHDDAAQNTRTKASPPLTRTQVADHIVLDDSDEDDFQIRSIKPAPAAQTPIEPTQKEEEDDPIFAALVRRAREQREATRGHSLPKLASPGAGSPPSLVESKGGLPTPPPPNDGVAALLITSQIPGTNPLVVQRKLSQRLQEIRVAWCGKQALPDGLTADDVFLTYRLRRLFDSTLVRNLGFEADAKGQIHMVGAEGKHQGVDRIHIEAVTDDILRRLKAERSNELSGASDLAQQDNEASQPALAAEESNIRLVLKAKAHAQPFKLKVKPSTQISRIVQTCRRHFEVRESQKIRIEFDGDELDEDSCIRDTEIEDLFTLDVFID